MKINGFDLVVVCANYDKEVGGYGDIYDCVEKCIEEHPDDDIVYGYYLKSGDTEIETPDWFDTIEDAVSWASNA